MVTTVFRTVAIGSIAALIFAGCGGGGGSTAPIPGGGGGNGTNGTTNFSGLSAAPMAVGDSRQFTPAESGYAGSYAVTSSAPGVVAVSPASGTGPFTATAAGPGSATISVADSAGHTSTVPLSVGSIGFGTMQTSMTPSSTQQFTPTEAGNAQFSVSSSAPSVVSVSPASGAGPFTLTAGANPGSATITVTDASGGHSAATVTVAAGAGGSPSGLTLSPQSLAAVPLNQVSSVTPSDPAGTTGLTASVANPAIATVVPAGNGTLTVVGNSAGSTTATVTDSAGHTATLPITVSPSPAPLISLNAIGDTNGVTGVGANAVVLNPSEAGYSGPFTATVTGSNATVLPAGNGNLLNVSVNAPGSSIVTVSDNQGHSSSIGLTAP